MTNGIHPKVALPAIAQLIVGGVLVVIGVVTHDNTTLTLGLGLIGASGLTGAVGYTAPAAGVTVRATKSDDELEAAGVLKRVQGPAQ